MTRKIRKSVQGYATTDGAGVHLTRVLGPRTVEDFDPFLMLDAFDTDDPSKYEAGFPMHPHRGIETISYVCKGEMTHRDSLKHEDTVGAGEVQWMTAGSGIMHEELLPSRDGMLGVQLWLNVPASRKMAPPAYHAVKRDAIREIPLEGGGMLRLLAGQFGEYQGHRGDHLPLDYYDIRLAPGQSASIPTARERSVMLFTLRGSVMLAGDSIREKTAVHTTPGESLELRAHDKQAAQVLVMSSAPLREPIAWGGPIVMNTRRELEQAFTDLQTGNFLQEKMTYE